MWALVTGDTGHPPDDRLAVSYNWGATWSISPVLPNLAGGFGVLDRITPTVAYAMGTGHATGEPGLDHIAYTADAARTWSYLPDPCATGPEGAARLAVLYPAAMWLVCSGQATAGDQAKTVYRSSDGGRDWSLVARACFPAQGCSPAGEIPASGYIGDLYAGSYTRAWLALARGTLLVSSDGGQRWAPALPGGDHAQQGPGVLSFSDPNHGWTIADTGVWETTDASSWQLVRPPGR